MNHKTLILIVAIIFTASLAMIMTGSLHAETLNGTSALSGTSAQCKFLPDTINVRLRDNYSHWPQGTSRDQIIPMEDYAWGVALGELHDIVPSGPYAGNGWDAQVIKAQAIAARTWGAYWCTKNLLPDGRRGVYDGGNDAQFDPYFPASTTVVNKFKKQSAVTKGMYLTWDDFLLTQPYDGKLIDAEFRNDVGEPTCSWNSGNETRAPCFYNGVVVTNYEFLTSVDNQYAVDISGPGFGQISAHSWRKADRKKASYADVLRKYYTGTWVQDDYYANYSEKFYTYNPSNRTCSSTVLWQGSTRSINYYWAGTPPNRPGVPADNFCVRWETNLTIDATDWYTFYTLRDDGMRLYIDGNLILDQWTNSSAQLQSVGVALTQGTHSIRLDYYDAGYDAVARLSINRSVGMIGRYYRYKVGSTGSIPSDSVMIRPDTPTKFDWVNASPQDTHSGYEPGVTEIPSNRFSVIWEGYIYVNGCGDVTFQGRMDDGMYAVLADANGTNQSVLINEWTIGTFRPSSTWRYKCTGTYKLQVRYFEETVNAVATFDWWYSGEGAPTESDTDE